MTRAFCGAYEVLVERTEAAALLNDNEALEFDSVNDWSIFGCLRAAILFLKGETKAANAILLHVASVHACDESLIEETSTTVRVEEELIADRHGVSVEEIAEIAQLPTKPTLH